MYPLLTRGRTAGAHRKHFAPGFRAEQSFPCKPGDLTTTSFINISNSANNHWLGLLKRWGARIWRNVQFSTPKARGERRAEVEAMVTAWTGSRTKIDAMTAIQNAGAPAGAVLDTKDSV